MTRLKMQLAVFILILGYTNLALALPEDSQKSITAIQDSAFINANTGETILKGNVIITRGNLKIFADKVLLERDKVTNNITRIFAEGNPVRFIDKPSIDGDLVEVKGLQIEFFPDSNNIITLGNAQIIQAQNTAHGERIDYNTVTRLMTIESKRYLSGNENDAQAELVIQPGVVD